MTMLERIRVPLSLLIFLSGWFTSCAFQTGLSYDAGTIGVSGLADGFGGYAEIMVRPGTGGNGFGVGPVLQVAGFATGGDADPIAVTSLEARYCRGFGRPSRVKPYWEIGSGFGLVWSPSIQRAALPLQGEIGVQASTGCWRFNLGLRERFLAMVGQGSPPFDMLNSVQVVIGLAAGIR